VTVSKKQLAANKKNAKKGGVKTPEGKAVVKYNALKHGLLAKEIVITVGEGAENPEEFQSLLNNLMEELQPIGSIEEMLVEKVASAYWRMRRAYTYEVGLIRSELDTVMDDFYKEENWQGNKVHRTDKEILDRIKEEDAEIESWKRAQEKIEKLNKQNKPLSSIFDLEEVWDRLILTDDDIISLEDEDVDFDTLSIEELKGHLNNTLGWSDKEIWDKLKGLCEERLLYHSNQKAELEKEKQKNTLMIQVKKKLGNVPTSDNLDRLLRYETTIERQFYKALHQLERLQRLRSGDNVPPPLEGNLDVNISNQD